MSAWDGNLKPSNKADRQQDVMRILQTRKDHFDEEWAIWCHHLRDCAEVRGWGPSKVLAVLKLLIEDGMVESRHAREWSDKRVLEYRLTKEGEAVLAAESYEESYEGSPDYYADQENAQQNWESEKCWEYSDMIPDRARKLIDFALGDNWSVDTAFYVFFETEWDLPRRVEEYSGRLDEQEARVVAAIIASVKEGEKSEIQ